VLSYELVHYSDFLDVSQDERAFLDTLTSSQMYDPFNPLRLSSGHTNVQVTNVSEYAVFNIPLNFILAIYSLRRRLYGPVRRMFMTDILNELIAKVGNSNPAKNIIFQLYSDDLFVLNLPPRSLLLLTNYDSRRPLKGGHMPIAYPVLDDQHMVNLEPTVTTHKFGFIGQTNRWRSAIISHLQVRDDSVCKVSDAWWKSNYQERWEGLRRQMISHLEKVSYSIVPEGAGFHVTKLTEAWLLGKVPVLISPFLQLPMPLLRASKPPLFSYPSRVSRFNIKKFRTFLDSIPERPQYSPSEVREFYCSQLSPNAVTRQIVEYFKK
jgi:hypothetical protein